MTDELVPTTPPAPLAIIEAGPLDRNPAAVYLASLSEGSRRAMRHSLTIVANELLPGSNLATFPWASLRYQHTNAVRSKLADRYAPATANRHIAALRGTLKEAWRLGLMSAEDYWRAVDLRKIHGSTASQAETGRHLTPGELAALLSTCRDKTASGARDAALLAVGYGAGLRRAELTGLQLADYDTDKQTLIVRHGKGNKQRVIPVAAGVLDALGDWLRVRGDESGPLFFGFQNGVLIRHAISPAAVWSVVKRRAAAAGVKVFSPHDLRRTFAGDLLDAGADIVTVQKLMGHANTTTTAGYDRRDAKAKRAAVNKLHVPYVAQWE